MVCCHDFPRDEDERHGAQAADGGGGVVAGIDECCCGERPGHDELAGQIGAERGERVGQPGDRDGRVAHHRRAETCVDLCSVEPQRRLRVGEVETVDIGHPVTKDDGARARVVGYRVSKGQLPVGDPAVDDLQRDRHRLCGGAHVVGGHAGTAQRRTHQESDLGFDPWCTEPGRPGGSAIGQHHVVKDVAVVGFIDAEQ